MLREEKAQEIGDEYSSTIRSASFTGFGRHSAPITAETAR